MSTPGEVPTLEAIHGSTDLLFQQGGTKIVGIGADIIVKYGERVNRCEADAMIFVATKTSIPVPRVMATFEHLGNTYICMERAGGQSLEDYLPEADGDILTALARELNNIVQQLQSLQGEQIGALNNGPCTDYLWQYNTDLSPGPFVNEAQFNDTLTSFYHSKNPSNFHLFLRSLYKDRHRIVYTHGDLTPRNIMVKDGRIVAILDWEFAGWYPEYWEYAKAFYGADWKTEWPLLIDKALKPFHYELMVHNILYDALC